MLSKKLMWFSHLKFSVILKCWVRFLEKSLTIEGIISRVLLNLAIMIMWFVLERINFETFWTNLRLHHKAVRLPFLRLNGACDKTITVSASKSVFKHFLVCFLICFDLGDTVTEIIQRLALMDNFLSVLVRVAQDASW